MTSQDLTPEQAKAMREIVLRHLAYFRKLDARMQRLGFPPDDPVVKDTRRTIDAMHALQMSFHYASCKHGVGR